MEDDIFQERSDRRKSRRTGWAALLPALRAGDGTTPTIPYNGSKTPYVIVVSSGTVIGRDGTSVSGFDPLE